MNNNPFSQLVDYAKGLLKGADNAVSNTVKAVASVPSFVNKTIQVNTQNPKAIAMNKQFLQTYTQPKSNFATAMKNSGFSDPLKFTIAVAKEQASKLPTEFPRFVRTVAEHAYGPTAGRIIGEPVANTGQALTQGAKDIYKGVQKVSQIPEQIKNKDYLGAAGSGAEGLIKGVFGGAKIVTSATPIFQVFNLMTGLPDKNAVTRTATGFVRGMTGENLSPENKGKKTQVGPFQIDPYETIGEFVGFTKNPVWQKIFPATSKIISKTPSVAGFIMQHLTKGGLEGYIQGVSQLPSNASAADKWNIIRDNVLLGAGAELTVSAGSKALSKMIESSGLKDKAVRMMDTLSNEWRKANIPVYDWSTRETKPMWQVEAAKTIKDKQIGLSVKSVGGEGAMAAAENLKNPKSDLSALEHSKLNKDILAKSMSSASSQEEAAANLTKYLEPKISNLEATPNTNELKGLRAAINRTMYNLAGVDPAAGKGEVKAFQTAFDNPDISNVLSTLDTFKNRIDDVIGQKTKPVVQIGEKAFGSVEAAKEYLLKPDPVILEKTGQIPPPTGGDGTKEPLLNVQHFNVTEENKQKINDVAEAIRPELEKIKGGTLSNEEVVKAAQTSDVLKRVASKDQTEKVLASVTRLRQDVAAEAQKEGISKQFLDDLKVLKGYSADAGRRLQILSVGADPNMANIKEDIVKQLMDLGIETDKILKASEGIDFQNPKQVTEFYRSFVKPTLGQVVDEYRYINLLSSPKTHIINAFSNLLQAGITNPATKLYSGALDFVANGITGGERQHYVREVPAYVRGSVSSIGDGLDGFWKALKGEQFMGRPDVNYLPTGNAITNKFQIIPRLLEASDVLFRTIIKGGEKESLAYKFARQGKEINPQEIEKLANDAAGYYVFRNMPDATNNTGQGHLLSAVDAMTQWIYDARRKPYIGKPISWFIPFVQTPMNILKQMIEYSPAGVATLQGATDKVEQLAKAMIGSTVMLTAAWIAQKGDATWAAPTSAKDKAIFYATGRQPYSMKIGDKWIRYDKLGIFSMPFTLAAATKYYNEQSPTAASDGTIQKLGRIALSAAKSFSDQSYVTGIGNLVSVLQGDPTAAAKTIGDIPRQLVPLTALQNWVEGIVDPVYRKAKTPIGRVMQTSPLTAWMLPAETDIFGNPRVRENRLFNAVSPLQVTSEKPAMEPVYDYNALMKQAKNIQNQVKAGKMTQESASESIKRLSDNIVANTQNNRPASGSSEQIPEANLKKTDNIAKIQPKTDYFKTTGYKIKRSAIKKPTLKSRAIKIKKISKGKQYKIKSKSANLKNYLSSKNYKFVLT